MSSSIDKWKDKLGHKQLALLSKRILLKALKSKKKKGEEGYVPLPVKIAIAREIYGKTMAKILEVTGDVNQNHTYNVINYASVQQIENDRGSVYEAPVVSLDDGKTIDAEFEEANEPDTATS